MKCPNCGLVDDNCRVTNSRPYKHTIKRTRKCSKCNHTWKTYEITEEEFMGDRYARKKQRWTPGELLNLVRLREEKISYIAIGKMLARSRMSVDRQVQKLLESGDYFVLLDELEGIHIGEKL